jgi:hypothetical protein
MLEAEHAALADWWGVLPDTDEHELLAVELYADEAAWAAGIEADGLAVPWGAGGYYHPSTGVAYLYRQPSVWYTRVLTLHEALHQYHHRARTQGAWVPGWFAEGLAEYLSLHDWHGGCLRLGRLPMLSLEDISADALAQADGGSLDLAGHIAGDSSWSRPLEWAMFRYFDRADDGVWAEPWAAFRDAIDAGETDRLAAFEQAFDAAPSQFDGPLHDWLQQEQQPLSPVYSEWIHVAPGAVDGFAWDVSSAARVKEPVSRFEVRFDLGDAVPAWGGVLLSFDDYGDYAMFLVGQTGELSVFDVSDGAVDWWNAGNAAVPADGLWTLRVEHGATESVVRVNGEPVTVPLDHSPAGGLALYAAEVRFSGIDWN